MIFKPVQSLKLLLVLTMRVSELDKIPAEIVVLVAKYQEQVRVSNFGGVAKVELVRERDNILQVRHNYKMFFQVVQGVQLFYKKDCI